MYIHLCIFMSFKSSFFLPQTIKIYSLLNQKKLRTPKMYSTVNMLVWRLGLCAAGYTATCDAGIPYLILEFRFVSWLLCF